MTLNVVPIKRKIMVYLDASVVDALDDFRNDLRKYRGLWVPRSRLIEAAVRVAMSDDPERVIGEL